MVEALQQYLDSSLVYNFTQGPDRVPDEATARREGINCVSLAHLALRSLFGQTLPPRLHCYEMLVDRTHLANVGAEEEPLAGDVVIFGRAGRNNVHAFEPIYNENGYLTNWRESPATHVGVCTGEREKGEPMILHATHLTGSVAVWPLSRFGDVSRYQEVLRIARLQLAS